MFLYKSINYNNKIQQLQAEQLLSIKDTNFFKENAEHLIKEVDLIKKELQYLIQENENKEQIIRDLENKLASLKEEMQHKLLIKDIRIWELQLENGLKNEENY